MRYSILCIILSAMINSTLNSQIDPWVEEIRAAENAFCQAVKERGFKEAFLEFAAEEAVLKRGDQLIKGKAAIASFYDNAFAGMKAEVSLTWSPSFVEVSDDGTLGYTYGDFVYARTDENGKVSESKGVFHTVWKRQSDGSWKYVWD